MSDKPEGWADIRDVQIRTDFYHWLEEKSKLELKRQQLHNYILMKLDEKDYHGIADAAMDLRELDARSKTIKEWLGEK